MSATAPVPAKLYRYEVMGELRGVECMGCHDVMEVPTFAVLHAGKRPERIRGNPENLLAWLELQELFHEKCNLFSDAEKAEQQREFRHGLNIASRSAVKTTVSMSRRGSEKGLSVVRPN